MSSTSSARSLTVLLGLLGVRIPVVEVPWREEPPKVLVGVRMLELEVL